MLALSHKRSSYVFDHNYTLIAVGTLGPLGLVAKPSLASSCRLRWELSFKFNDSIEINEIFYMILFNSGMWAEMNESAFYFIPGGI